MTEKRFRVSDVILLTKPNAICDGDIFLNQKEACDLLNKYDVEYNQCRKDVLRLEENLDYYKTKYASLETGLIQSDREIKQLKQENQSWLKTASRMDTIHHEDREYCERIHRENEKLKQQFFMILIKMGINPFVQCKFCEHGDFYTEYNNHGKDITHGFRCEIKGYVSANREFCHDWKIEVD